MTFLHEPGSYGLSTERWRLIHFANGDEELYDTVNDRYEWANFAQKPEQAERLKTLRRLAPTQFAELIPPSDAALTKLAWHPAKSSVPASKPDGDPFNVVFTNKRADPVKVF